MTVRRTFWVFLLAGAAAWLMPRTVHAGDSYTCSIVEDDQNTSSTHLNGKSGKLVIAPSKKTGDGGVTITLTANKAWTCSSCTNNVLELGLRAIGTDLSGANGLSGAGFLFDITGGKALFKNGKNKTGTGPIFGALASAIFTKPLGIGLVKLRLSGSDNSECSTPPLLPGSKCNDGLLYAVAGFVVPIDPSFLCTDDAVCPLADVCSPTAPRLCVPQDCTSDGDCRSGSCNINKGTCCDPSIPNSCSP